MDRLMPWQPKKNLIPASTTFMLTELGRDKAGEYTGDERSRILAVLDSHGASNISEIAKNAGLNRSRVEKSVPSLIQGGYIRRARGIEE